MMAIESPSRMLIFVVVIISVVSVESQNIPCTTPAKEPGQCVTIRRCRNIYNIVTGPIKTAQKHVDYINRATCTLPNVKRSICCKPTEVVHHPNTKLLPKECGKLPSERISYGEKTNVFDYPWMAVLQYDNNGNIVDGCGGTLINKRYILTAAHCIKTRGIELTKIRLGEHTKNQEEDCNIYRDDSGEETERDCADPVEDYGIEWSVFHPNYNKPRYSNDIGLIRLNRNVVMKHHIHPICLPVTPELRTKLLPKYIVTGWGTTENQTGSDVLLQATLPRVGNRVCQQRIDQNRLNVKLSDTQMCAGGQKQVDTCKGDSGGPVGFSTVYDGKKSRFVQFGVISAGVNSCGYRSVPGIYCLVGSYMDWILDNIKP